MKLRTRLTLLVAPAIIAGSLIAAPAGSQPFEGPDDIVVCPMGVDCGPDDPHPGDDGPDGFKTPPGDPGDPGEPEPEPEPEPETPEVPDAEPEAPRPGKPNFTG